MKTSIVIPYYNETRHIKKLLSDLAVYKLPVVVVDDGSSEVLKLNKTVVLRHDVNLGKGAAMKTGVEYAFANGADSVIFMDSDGQHSPTDLPKFIQEIKKNKYDLFFGNRVSNFGVPLVRFLGNKFASTIMAIFFGTYVSDSLCGFRAMTKKGYNKIKWESDGYGVELEMIVRIAKSKASFIEIPIDTIYFDDVKGVTLLDAISIFGSVVKWKLTL